MIAKSLTIWALNAQLGLDREEFRRFKSSQIPNKSVYRWKSLFFICEASSSTKPLRRGFGDYFGPSRFSPTIGIDKRGALKRFTLKTSVRPSGRYL